MHLHALLHDLPIDLPPDTPDPDLDHITLDLHEVRPHTLFIARRAFWGDTHAHIAAALDRGAAAILHVDPPPHPLPPTHAPLLRAHAEDPTLGLLADRFYGHPTRRLRVYGVTGTNGKTSTTWLIEHLLRALGERPALMGTVTFRFEQRAVDASNTTPDALVIHRFAHDALRLGATALVLEVSSHGLALDRTAGVAFDSVGFTNLTQDHLDFHGTLDRYLDAKARLFTDALAASRAAGKAAAATALIDDGHGADLLRRAAPFAATTQALSTTRPAPDAWHLHALTPDPPLGLRFALTPPSTPSTSPLTARLPMIGAHNAHNAALAALMVEATHPGALPALLDALATFPGVPGRLQPAFPDALPPHTPLTLIDYAHTPDAVARVLQTIRPAPPARLIVVLGCGGDRDRQKRPLMARAALDHADLAIFTADNPRSEDPEAILRDMTAPLPPHAPCLTLPDRTEAIRAALDAASPQDTLAICGKGHEATQTHAGRRYALDDAEEVRRLTAARLLHLHPDHTPLLHGWSPERRAQATPDLPTALIHEARRRRHGLLLVLGDLPTAPHTLHLHTPDDALRLAPIHRVLAATSLPPHLTPDLIHPDPHTLHLALTTLQGGEPATPTQPHIPSLLQAPRSPPPP